MNSLVTILRTWDGRLVEDLSQRRTVLVTQFMIFVTQLGDGWAWVLLGLGVLVFDPENTILFTLIAGLMLNIPLYSALKHKFSRPRPYQACHTVTCIRRPMDRFSFPSGHTSVAFVVLWIAGNAYIWLFPPLALLAILIGASRVYLGVHYPSDVLAGSILGSICGAVAMWIC